MNNINLINGDALQELDKMIEDGVKVDAIITDPPYGTIQGMQLKGSKHKVNWDINIDWKNFFDKAFKITNTIILFGQQPTWSECILFGKKWFKEELIWVKNKSAQGFHADKMHLKFFENIGVFRNGKGTFNSIKEPKIINSKQMPLRAYAQRIMTLLNIPRSHIHKKLGHRKMEFFLFFRGTLFNLPKKDVWEQFTKEFQEYNFKTYKELIELKEKDKTIKTKLGSEYSDTKRNILIFDKDLENYHPTQKPVKLMEYLIKTYTNENDLVLDTFMGSGTTGVACKNTNRKFIGVEKDKKYFEIAKERIENEKI